MRQVGFHVEHRAESAECSGDGFVGRGRVASESDPSCVVSVGTVLSAGYPKDERPWFIPMEVSTPFTENRSLIETGRP